MCSLIMVGNDSDKVTDKEYFNLISRGRLTVPSRQMAEFVCACFAILEYADQFMIKNHKSTTRVFAEQVLGIYSPKCSFTCENHIEKGLIFAIKIVVNIFYNYKQKFHQMKFERILWNIFKKGKGPKKIHFKEKILSSFYLRFCITAFFLLIFVCLPKIFYFFIINFLEKDIYVFLYNFNIFQIKYS